MANQTTTKPEFKIFEISQEIINKYNKNGPFNTLLKVRAKQQQTKLIVEFASLEKKSIKLTELAETTGHANNIFLTNEDTNLTLLSNTLPDGVTICAHQSNDSKKKPTYQFLFIHKIGLDAELFFIESKEFTPNKNIVNFSTKEHVTLAGGSQKVIQNPKTTTIDSALWLALSIEHIYASSLIDNKSANSQ